MLSFFLIDKGFNFIAIIFISYFVLLKKLNSINKLLLSTSFVVFNQLIFNYVETPSGLFNQLAIIHPFIVIFIYSFLFNKNKTVSTLQSKSFLLLILSTGLLLGGWWAYQEFTWGGWWNWDGVELPIFILWFTLLINLHRLDSIKFLHEIWTKYVIVMLTSIIFYIKIIETSSVHAFINSKSHYIYYWTMGSLNSQGLLINFGYYISPNLSNFNFLKIYICLIFSWLYIYIIYFISFFKQLHRLIKLLILSFFIIHVQYFYTLLDYYESCYTISSKLTVFIQAKIKYICWIKPKTISLGFTSTALTNLVN